MNKKITRRTAGKLVFGAAAAAAISPFPLEAESTPRSPTRALSAKERKDLAKTAAQLAKAAENIRKMKIPIGTEPAFIFAPRIDKP
jgi:hypothetical protein